MNDILINDDLTIPASAITFRFSRSGGKGGQNVNKVETKVELLIDVNAIQASQEQKEKIRKRLQNKFDAKGLIRIVTQESRSQWKNRNIALEKLIAMITEALKEDKERFKTKPTRSSKQVRVTKKIQHGKKKTLRQKNISTED